VAYFALEGRHRQMCLALDLWWLTPTHYQLARGQSFGLLMWLLFFIFVWLCDWIQFADWLSSVVFCSCNTESDWSQTHDNIIKKVNSRYNLSGSNTGNEAATTLRLSHLLKTISINGSEITIVMTSQLQPH